MTEDRKQIELEIDACRPRSRDADPLQLDENGRDLLRRSLERAVRYVPGLRWSPVVRSWSGLRPYVADKKPIVGPVEEVPGFHMAAGHEGMGVTLAPITGLLVTEAITGQEPSLPLKPMALSRFYPEMRGKSG